MNDKPARSRAEDGSPAPRSLRGWNRLTLRFFGPPSVGRYDGPYPEVDPDPDCPFCGSRESSHETFRTADGKTLRRCPTA
ncbi:MAG TPA: hypothetical protein VFT62_00465 [Mycobacteriales bacterium]|nr:hypothetical protein [Mycobacteriales bacterium]